MTKDVHRPIQILDLSTPYAIPVPLYEWLTSSQFMLSKNENSFPYFIYRVSVFLVTTRPNSSDLKSIFNHGSSVKTNPPELVQSLPSWI